VTTVDASGFAAALAAERLQNLRRANLLRCLGVSALLALQLFVGRVLRWSNWQGDVTPFVAYWVASGVLLAIGMRSERALRASGLAIVVVDMPAVFFLQQHFSFSVAEARGQAGFTLGIFVMLVYLSSLLLERRPLVVATLVASVLETELQRLSGVDAAARTAAVIVLLLSALAFAYGSRRAVALVASVTREQMRRARLGRYFSPQVAARLAERSDAMIPADRREVTILFADVRGFTALAEQLPVDRIVALLNEHLGRMAEVLFAHGGTLDKYMGDGIMAYFGAPEPQDDHAARAVACALAMQAALADANAARRAHGGTVLAMGVGVHTGAVVMGDIGSPEHSDFTLIGDAVNVASRIEQLTKETGRPVLVSAATRDRLGAGWRCEPAGLLPIRGRSEPVQCFSPVAAG